MPSSTSPKPASVTDDVRDVSRAGGSGTVATADPAGATTATATKRAAKTPAKTPARRTSAAKAAPKTAKPAADVDDAAVDPPRT